MKHILKLTSAAIAVGLMTFSAVPEARAKTPPEVLTPYKAYRAALKADDKVKASKKAYEAWKKAEDLLGDSKTTGDLAFNFADVDLTYRTNTMKLYKQRVQAFKRAIELSSYYGEDAADMETDRRLKLAAHGITLSNIRKGKLIPEQNLSYFRGVEKALDAYGFRGTTYEADYESLLSRYYELRGEFERALTHADKAINLFESRDDKLVSPYFYFVKFFRANILAGKDDKISAALQYQEVMQNLEGDLDPDHPFVAKAFKGWMLTRSELEDAGRLAEAEEAGLCECWPYENYKNKPQPLLRVPPTMPKRAKRSGHVQVSFDIDEAGKPINIKSIYATESVFVEPSLKSVEQWLYSPMDSDADPQTRKGISSKVTFMLRDRGGRIIPEKRL